MSSRNMWISLPKVNKLRFSLDILATKQKIENYYAIKLAKLRARAASSHLNDYNRICLNSRQIHCHKFSHILTL